MFQERPSFRLEDQLPGAGVQHTGAVIPTANPLTLAQNIKSLLSLREFISY